MSHLSPLSDMFKGYYWEVLLECGHHAERPIKYKKGSHQLRGFALMHHPPGRNAILPFTQKKALCDYCA